MSHHSLLGNFPPPVVSEREERPEENGSEPEGGDRKQRRKLRSRRNKPATEVMFVNN